MPPVSPQASDLCLSCGICCDGTIFTRGKLKQDEIGRVRSLGLEVIREQDKDYFRIPCPRFVDGCCSVYSKRPTVCGTFRCALLRRLDSGEVGLDEARGLVVEARRLQKEAVDEVPDAARKASRPGARSRLANEAASAPPEQRPAIARRLLKVIALDVFLERWFEVPKEQKSNKGDEAG